MNKPVPWPCYAEDEIEAATAVLRSGKVNYWTGEECRTFEREFATYCGARHAVALANGTVALELALHALGIGEGDDVIVTPRTFIASASCAVLRGARPVFADVDRDSQNITAETIERALTPETQAIITVHHAGWPCEMEAIRDLAQTHDLKIIEDCAQAHGATYRSRPVGAWGDAGAFSFCQDKIISTGGEGGMLVTNDETVWKTAWAYKDHGKDYDAVHAEQDGRGFRWLHNSFGTNWRMTEVQAAIGRIQLGKLPDWTARRRHHAEFLANVFEAVSGLRVIHPPEHVSHAYYKYYVFVRPKALRTDWSRDRIVAEINAKGVPCFTGSCPEIYLEKAFDSIDAKPAQRLPVSLELGATSLTFQVHPTLSDLEIEQTSDVVSAVVGRACR